MHLLKHFKELTIRSENAQKLKGLVLQLAIQGKLTANWRQENKNIEPASELLKRIEKEKAQLIQDKKLKKEKSLPFIKEEEIPFKISNSWAWTRLGDIGTTNVGLTYKPTHKNDDGVPVLRSSNVQEGELCLKDLVRVNTDYREKDIIRKGDLLICARNGSRRLVGKCTIIGQIDEVMVFGAFMAIFRSDFNPYLQLFIQSPQYRSKLDGVETTTINQITQGNLKATEVPLPPLEEQKAIVEVVNQLFKEVDQLEQLTLERITLKERFVTSALNHLTTNNAKNEWAFLQKHFHSFFNETINIKKLRETILQLAVQGKLTADWRASHPKLLEGSHHAIELLKRIQEEKAQLIKDKKIKKEKPLPPITKDEIPYDLPEGWVWEYLGTSMMKITDGTHHSPLNVENGAFKYVSAKNIKANGVKLSNITYVTEEAHREIYARCNPEFGDLLYIKDGATTGICCINDLDEEFSMLSSVALIKLPEVILNEYLLRIMRSPYYYDLMRAGMTGVAITRVTLAKLKASIIPIPPIEEQKAIVLKVNTLMELCDALEEQVLQSQEQSEKLMQSVLREVFEGKKELETV